MTGDCPFGYLVLLPHAGCTSCCVHPIILPAWVVLMLYIAAITSHAERSRSSREQESFWIRKRSLASSEGETMAGLHPFGGSVKAGPLLSPPSWPVSSTPQSQVLQQGLGVCTRVSDLRAPSGQVGRRGQTRGSSGDSGDTGHTS